MSCPCPYPGCSFVNQTSAPFCGECGKYVKYCSCGSSNRIDSRYCRNCREKINYYSDAAYYEKKANFSNNCIIKGIDGVALLARADNPPLKICCPVQGFSLFPASNWIVGYNYIVYLIKNQNICKMIAIDTTLVFGDNPHPDNVKIYDIAPGFFKEIELKSELELHFYYGDIYLRTQHRLIKLNISINDIKKNQQILVSGEVVFESAVCLNDAVLTTDYFLVASDKSFIIIEPVSLRKLNEISFNDCCVKCIIFNGKSRYYLLLNSPARAFVKYLECNKINNQPNLKESDFINVNFQIEGDNARPFDMSGINFTKDNNSMISETMANAGGNEVDKLYFMRGTALFICTIPSRENGGEASVNENNIVNFRPVCNSISLYKHINGVLSIFLKDSIGRLYLLSGDFGFKYRWDQNIPTITSEPALVGEAVLIIEDRRITVYLENNQASINIALPGGSSNHSVIYYNKKIYVLRDNEIIEYVYELPVKLSLTPDRIEVPDGQEFDLSLIQAFCSSQGGAQDVPVVKGINWAVISGNGNIINNIFKPAGGGSTVRLRATAQIDGVVRYADLAVEVVRKRVAIKINPAEISLKSNETYNLNNQAVTIVYSDNTSETCVNHQWTLVQGCRGSLLNQTYTAPVSDRKLTEKITAEFEKLTAELSVKVHPVKLVTGLLCDDSIINAAAGERFDLSTVNVRILYSDSSTQTIVPSWGVSEGNAQIEGNFVTAQADSGIRAMHKDGNVSVEKIFKLVIKPSNIVENQPEANNVEAEAVDDQLVIKLKNILTKFRAGKFAGMIPGEVNDFKNIIDEYEKGSLNLAAVIGRFDELKSNLNKKGTTESGQAVIYIRTIIETIKNWNK